MKYYKIIQQIANAIANLDIGDGAKLNVYLGEDPNNPLSIIDCPFCLIMPSFDYIDVDNTLNLEIDFGIKNDVIIKNENITEYQGYQVIDDLADKIRKTLFSCLSKDTIITVLDYDINGNNYPIYEAGFTIKIKNIRI